MNLNPEIQIIRSSHSSSKLNWDWITSEISTSLSEILEDDDWNRKSSLWMMIWRMNPPHIWHINVIKRILEETDRVILFLWSANVQDYRNPFSYEERKYFIEHYFSEELKESKLIVEWLDDVWNFEKWVWILWNKIQSTFPDFEWYLNIYWWDFQEDMALQAISEYVNKLPVEPSKMIFTEVSRDSLLIDWEEVSATNLRKALLEDNYELIYKLVPKKISELIIGNYSKVLDILKSP